MFEQIYSVFIPINSGARTLIELINISSNCLTFNYPTILEDEFERYFPEINGNELDLERSAIRLPIEKVFDSRNEFLELKMNSSVKIIFDEKYFSKTEFWPLMINYRIQK